MIWPRKRFQKGAVALWPNPANRASLVPLFRKFSGEIKFWMRQLAQKLPVAFLTVSFVPVYPGLPQKVFVHFG